jgi:Spy/CpxP family protein refolding chaperone
MNPPGYPHWIRIIRPLRAKGKAICADFHNAQSLQYIKRIGPCLAVHNGNRTETNERRCTMKKITLTLTAVLAGLLLTTSAFAWGPGPGKGRGYGPCGNAGLEKLNLTDDQKAKIEALQDANDKATRPVREKIFDKSVELRRLWLQANPDKGKISAAQKELRTLRNEMEDKTTALRLDINKVLTPEQKDKLANSRWGGKTGFGPRGGMRGDCGFGAGQGPGPCLGMGMYQ